VGALHLSDAAAQSANSSWEELRDHARRVCAERATQLTGLREAVLRELWAAGAPVGAYDLANRLGRRVGSRLAANSVYRVLTLFQALGLVHRVESKHAYMVASADGRSADIFLLCDGCGAVSTVSDVELAARLAARSEALGFHPTRQVVEVAGRCHDCDERARGHG